MNFSIALAVYNGEKYISQQIESILPQMGLNDELILSYDKSEDESLLIIEKFAKEDKRVKVIINHKPGLFNNFENAISHCNNEIVFISDQDDIWTKNKCEIMMNNFLNSEIDMVIHNGVHFNSATYEESKDFFSMYQIKNGIIRNLLKPRYSGCCMAFRRKLVSIMLPIPKTCGGYDHWIGMVGEYYGNVKFIDEILIYHRLHDSNFTPISRRSLLTIIKARSSILYNLFMRRYKAIETTN
ncbi:MULTISPECIES: glycosyltransferase [Streptococcaceae]|uniref:glycosyltransferase n=1 Tax=Streptococcaceae TaxID=1300 RepID=UPI0009C3ADB0|nr:glycosyltransferase [Lactococcus cremoris]ARE24930.1 glycosyltransferase [Lactococcus cremoris]